MWRNREVTELTRWLRELNRGRPREARVRFHGLDLYSMFTSMAVVLHYLGGVEPEAAGVARARHGTLISWQRDPADETRAVTPLDVPGGREPEGIELPDTFPFGL